jgi:hypothetical protein
MFLTVLAASDDKSDHPPMVDFRSELSLSTDSNESMTQAAEWFQTCSENHDLCKVGFPKTSFVPTRLIEIWGSDMDSLKIRLKRRESLPPEICYASLSHCWGSTMPFMLKLETLDSCLQSIQLTGLSKVFRDTIKFAWRVNLRYVWIDSLCKIHVPL